MDVAKQRRNAKKFIEEWKDRGREKQDSQSFWLSFGGMFSDEDIEIPPFTDELQDIHDRLLH